MKNTIFLFFLGLLFFSCEGDNDAVSGGLLPVSITSGDIIKVRFEYDAQGRLTQLKDTMRTIQFHYKEQNLVKTVETSWDKFSEICEFTKTKDKIKVDIDYYSQSNQLMSEDSVNIRINDKGMPVEIISGAYKNQYQYDSNGNLSKNEFFIMGEVSFTLDFTYDSKVGFMSKVNTPHWWFVFQHENNFVNNLAAVTEVDPRGQSRTVSYAYSYDDANYPIEMKKNTASGQHYNVIEINYKKR